MTKEQFATVHDLGTTRKTGKKRVLIKYYLNGFSEQPTVMRLVESFREIVVPEVLTLELPVGKFDFPVMNGGGENISVINNNKHLLAELRLDDFSGENRADGKRDNLYFPIAAIPSNVNLK